MVTFPCVSNAVRRASAKALRTAEMGAGVLEGDGDGEVEFKKSRIRLERDDCQKHSAVPEPSGKEGAQQRVSATRGRGTSSPRPGGASAIRGRERRASRWWWRGVCRRACRG